MDFTRLTAYVPVLMLFNTFMLLILTFCSPAWQQTPRHIDAVMYSHEKQRPAVPRPLDFSADPGIMQAMQQQLQFLQKMRMDYGQLHCRVYDMGPTGGFCVNKTHIHVGGNGMWDKPMCAKMVSLLRRKSVLDLGCGLGHYGKCLAAANAGITWTGLDGSEGIEAATDGYVKFADLAVPMFMGKRYDWVMSLEVGEHIPAKYEGILFDNIVRHAREGVLLTWALPGQGGHSHVNEKSNSYVIAQMAQRGFAYDNATSTDLRRSAELPHFQSTTMVFRKDSQVH